MLQVLAVENYRSLRRLILPLGPLTVITGANGAGKSSVYRCLGLLAEASRQGMAAAVAREGGLPSLLWAGPRSGLGSDPVTVRLGFSTDGYGYALDLGVPPPTPWPTRFGLDPEVKRECIWHGPLLRPSSLLADRGNGYVRVRGADDEWHGVARGLHGSETVLSELADPEAAPEVLAIRDQVRAWRFYHHFRSDPDAPARSPSVGTRTPVLAADGGDVAAAVQTIREAGEGAAFDAAVDLAFPGSRVIVHPDPADAAGAGDGALDLRLQQPGMLRPLSAAELSDGTLRYLIWVTALLSTTPPPLLVVNEPETSLHPDLVRPLAGVLADTATRTQVVLVSHSSLIVEAVDREAAQRDQTVTRVELVKEQGTTRVANRATFDEPAWRWPKR